MSALLVHLPTTAASTATEYAYAVSNDGTSVAASGAAQASVLPMPGRAGNEVVAVVPVTMLSWHRTELPKGVTPKSPRLRAVLEGLLEDRLLDEPESLHFALAPDARAEAPVWVATCNREWLRGHVQALESAGRTPARIVPELSPRQVPDLHAMGEPASALLVVASDDGVMALPLGTSALALLPELPASTPIYAEPAVAALTEQVLQHTPTLQQPAERWLASARSPWDLAQFDLSSTGRARAMKKIGALWGDLLAAPQWRPARWALLLLVVLNVVGLNARALRERSALEARREDISRTLTQAFPQVKVVVDAPVQMDRELATLRQATGATSGRDLETMLAALAGALPAQKSLTGIDYTNGELRARGLGLSPDQAQQLASALRSQGYAVTPSGDTLAVAPLQGQP